MSPTSFDLLNVFVKSPGDFLYFLIVIVMSLLGLAMSFNLQSLPQLQGTSRRYVIGFGGTLWAWFIFVAGALFVTLTRQQSGLILPPVERLLSVVVVVAIGWALVTADHAKFQRQSNIVALVLIGLAFVGYLLTAVGWSSSFEAGLTDFNIVYNTGWSLALAAVCAFGVASVIMLFTDVTDAPLKIVFFALIFAAALYQALAGPFIGSYPGAIRLAFVMALIIPIFILYRIQALQLVALRDRAKEMQVRAEAASLRTAPRPTPVDSQSAILMRTLGKILDNATAATLPEQIIKATLDTVRLDVGFLLRLQDANYADIIYAYDKVMQRSPSGLSLNLNNQPTLINVIERRVPRTLYVDRNREELEDLFTRLDVDRIGTVYFYPLVRDNQLKAVMGVGLPYTERELDPANEELLKSVSILASSLISLSDEATETRFMAEDRAIQAMVEGVALSNVPEDAGVIVRQEMQASLQTAREQIAQLSKQVLSLTMKLGDERSRLTTMISDDEEALSISQAITAISDQQHKLREERDLLATRVKEAETTLTGVTASSDVAVVDQLVSSLERDKQKLTRERDRLQGQLNEIQVQGNLMLPEYMQQIIARMQEEQTRLETEKSQLSDQLIVMQNQMQSLGIETSNEGMSPLIAQLYDERATLNNKLEVLQHDKEVLLTERSKLSDSISRTKDVDARTSQLQGDVEHLAQDREAVIKQRDRIRHEYEEVRQKLDTVKEHRARLLAQVSGYEMELNEAREEQSRLRLEIQDLANSRSDLMHLRDKLMMENHSLQASQEEGIAQSTGDTARIVAINSDMSMRLQGMVTELSEARNRLEHELNDAKSKLAQADMQLEQSAQNAVALIATVGSYDAKNPDLFIGLVQELRTPLTSLIGYVDLLLGESAGILGEMQRKFLQRVSANVARMQIMIEDLVQVANLDSGSYKIEPMPISVVALIEDAITNGSIQFREKALSVGLDLDDDLPLLPADKDALSQIIGQLLTNAYLVSPPNSQVRVIAKQQNAQLKPQDDLTPVVLVSVEDRGGGIQPEDIPRVFARKYKAENPLIQGLGDTGVGMSIAKALAEAHGGRLWVETKANVGSIFSFVLPLERVTESKE